MKSTHISARAGRVIAWVVAVLVAGYLFNEQQKQQDASVKDRAALRALVVQTKQDNTVITNALCTYIEDLTRRKEGTEQLLKEHPEGLPGLATVQALKSGIDAQEHAIDALNSIRCSKKK
jgi:hypothetical protein